MNYLMVIIFRYGAIHVINTDLGIKIVSKVIAELCELYDIKKYSTTPYLPQSNRLVERLKQTLVDIIALIEKAAQKP